MTRPRADDGVPHPDGRDLLFEVVDLPGPWWTCHPSSAHVPGAPGFHASTVRGRFSPVRAEDGSVVPVVYLAGEEMGAVAEVMLRTVNAGGAVHPGDYERRAVSEVAISRPARLLVLHSAGLIRAGVTAARLTATPADDHVYQGTVRWAQAAYDAGADGLTWMSRLWGTAQAVMLFGPSIASEVAFGRAPVRDFTREADKAWLTWQCARAGVDVL